MAVAALALGACGTRNAAGTASSAPSTTVQPATSTTARAAAPVTEKDFDRNNFDRPTDIDNVWFPLKPGKQLVYDGETKGEDGLIRHRVVFTVTDLTKVVDGVRNVVVWDRDYNDGKLVETELAFFAQDNDGNVWRMGEYPEEYKNGKFVRCPAWIHGIAKAVAGIEMRAKPQPGTPSYSQGWGPGVNFTDRGQVDQTGQKIKGPMGSYDDVLVIAEVSRIEKDAHQLKFFARGVGNVRVAWRGKGEKTKETLDLVKVEQLSPAELEKVRAEALKLEKNAYKVSKNVYAQTAPAQATPVGADQ